MLIAQLSDPHYVPADVRLFGRLDAAGCLERAVAHVNALAPDVVLITGDLTNDGDAGSMPPAPRSSAGCARRSSCSPAITTIAS